MNNFHSNNKSVCAFVTILFMLFANLATGQSLGECATSFDTTAMYQPLRSFDYSSDTWLYKYRTPGYWIPQNTTPIKTIMVNWVICRDDNGGNGWQDSQAFRDEVDLMFERINQVYSTSLPKGYDLSCEPQYTHIYDSRIRFELNQIIFIDSTLFNQCGVGEYYTIYSIVDYVHSHYPSSSGALTHIFTQPNNPIHPNIWGEYNAYYSDYSFVITQGSMQDPTEVVWPNHVAHITHEYGHALGLDHTYEHERTCLSHFDFLDDVFGECPEDINPCFHYNTPCDDEHVCYLSKEWFQNNFEPPYPLMSGSFESPRYISPKSMGRMHRALSLYGYRFLVPNEAMHKYVKEKYPYTYSLSITEDETWDFAIKMYQNIVVTNNATLTITGEVKMPINGKIIVHPGAKLIIDGGRVTSAHEQPWQGIEVWGNSNTHQYEVNGSYGQGYLEMKNGATIENAVCAVELWRPNYWSTTGGIIRATDATFKNNATSIHALCYTNYNPSNYSEADYNAVFKNCSFVVDEDYLGTEAFHRHVTLAAVDGIRFFGCDFSAKRGVTGVNQWCVGINAYDARFSVNSLCTSTTVMPCTGEYLKKSTFTGLCSGIMASSNGNHPCSFTVREAVFTNNDRGIHAIGTGFPTILMNEFYISREEYCNFNYGVILDHVTNFCIEENVFRPVANTGGRTVGIAVYDSYSVNNIHRNQFYNLTSGNVARGQNISNQPLNPSRGVLAGLTYTCNENSENQGDFHVFLRDGVGNIQQVQGSYQLPAGNTFGASHHHFNNQGPDEIVYYHNNTATGQTPNALLNNNVSLQGTPNVNPCYSHYGDTPVSKSAQERAALESEYLAAYSAYLNLKQLYDSRIDGGSTTAQLADINAATPADLWELRAQLLGLSPYVSRQVLAAAADRDDVFTDPVLFEILAANPDELRSDSLISYLENKEHPLPDYMIDLLRQIAGGTTARTAMVAQMNKFWHDYSLAAGDIVRSNLNDTVANPTELRNWLGSMNDIAADRMVISSYLHEGDSTSAFTLAAMLPELYGLQGEQLEDHAGYMRLLQIYQTLKRTGRTVYELTEAETAAVDSLAENGTGVSRLMAQSLQEQVTGVMTETCLDLEIPELPGGDRGKAFVDEGSMNKAAGFTASLSPNPATTWTVVDYALPSSMSNATVVLANTLGVTVMTAELDGNHGQKVLDLRGLPVGVYLYTIRCGSLVEAGKLVVTQ